MFYIHTLLLLLLHTHTHSFLFVPNILWLAKPSFWVCSFWLWMLRLVWKRAFRQGSFLALVGSIVIKICREQSRTAQAYFFCSSAGRMNWRSSSDVQTVAPTPVLRVFSCVSNLLYPRMSGLDCTREPKSVQSIHDAEERLGGDDGNDALVGGDIDTGGFGTTLWLWAACLFNSLAATRESI